MLLLVDILMFRFVIKFSILESLGWVVFLFLQVRLLLLSLLYFPCLIEYCALAVASEYLRLQHGFLSEKRVLCLGSFSLVF